MEKTILTFTALLLIMTLLASCGVAPSGVPETTQAPVPLDKLAVTEAENETGEPAAPVTDEVTEAPETAKAETAHETAAQETEAPEQPDLLYTYLTRDGIQYSLYPDKICLYFLDDENAYVHFEDIPGNKILQYYKPGEPISFVIGNGIVEAEYEYNNGGTDVVSTRWTILSVSYMGQHADLSGVDFSTDAYVGIKMFDADGIFALSRVFYNYSEAYLLTKDSVCKFSPEIFSPDKWIYEGEPIVFYKGEDGKAHYKKHLEIPMSHFQVPEYDFDITSRNQYFGEEGTVEIAEGSIKFNAEKTYSWSDYFEMNGTSFDEWFEKYSKERFGTVENLFANSRALIFEEVLMEKRMVMQGGRECALSMCVNSGKYVGEWIEPRVSLIDFDRDGRTEMIIKPKSESYAFIIRYDDPTDRFYAYYIPAAEGMTFYSNGEFGTETSRTRVTEFNGAEMLTEDVVPDGNTPEAKKASWQYIGWLGGK